MIENEHMLLLLITQVPRVVFYSLVFLFDDLHKARQVGIFLPNQK